MTQTTPPVGFVEAGKLYFNNATDFKGRARRSEYWMAVLFLSVVTIPGAFVLGLIGGLLGETVGSLIIGLVSLVWGILYFVASLSLCIRRLHDTGRSGWWYLLGIIPIGSLVLLAFFCMDSVEDNQWGPNPKIVKQTEPALPPVSKPTPQPEPQPVPPTYDPTVYEPIRTPAPPAPPAPPVAPVSQLHGLLQLQTGPMAGKSFRIPAGRTVTIGRNPSKCELALPSYNVVSGTHCKIAFGNRTITILDLNSTNGTFVNGTRLTPGKAVTVREGATIQLANNTCVFQLRFE